MPQRDGADGGDAVQRALERAAARAARAAEMNGAGVDGSEDEQFRLVPRNPTARTTYMFNYKKCRYQFTV